MEQIFCNNPKDSGKIHRGNQGDTNFLKKKLTSLQHSMGGEGEKIIEGVIFVPGSPLSPLSPFSPGWASRPSRPSLPGWPGLPCNPGDPGMPGLPVHKLGILLSSSELEHCTAITSSNERGHVCRDVIAQSVEKKKKKWKNKKKFYKLVSCFKMISALLRLKIKIWYEVWT